MPSVCHPLHAVPLRLALPPMYECCPTQVTELETRAAFFEHLEETDTLKDVVVQGLDLTDERAERALRAASTENACFLGCRLSEAAEDHVHETGGTIFPAFVGLPFNPYRGSLYTPEELMDGYERGRPETSTETVDARIYEYVTQRRTNGRDAPVMDALAFRIHDHAIDDAL